MLLSRGEFCRRPPHIPRGTIRWSSALPRIRSRGPGRIRGDANEIWDRPSLSRWHKRPVQQDPCGRAHGQRSSSRRSTFSRRRSFRQWLDRHRGSRFQRELGTLPRQHLVAPAEAGHQRRLYYSSRGISFRSCKPASLSRRPNTIPRRVPLVHQQLGGHSCLVINFACDQLSWTSGISNEHAVEGRTSLASQSPSTLL